jgi:hypothetical protein
MKYPKFSLVAIVLFLTAIYQIAGAQNFLRQPESIVFDSLHNRYLVSNWQDGAIVQIDSNQTQTFFNTDLYNQYNVAGLHIVDDTLYAGVNFGLGPKLMAFDLNTGDSLFSIILSEVQLINDITSDTSGFLYITAYFTDRIYKINRGTHEYSAFVISGLDMPNGIVFDAPNNQLLVMSEGGFNEPIVIVNLADSTTSVLVETNILSTDGLDMDPAGRMYFTSWQTDRVYAYDSLYDDDPIDILAGLNNPAGIEYNHHDSVLAVTNFGNNSVSYLTISDSDNDNVPDLFDNCVNEPNPDQSDIDDDNVGDSCDNCLNTPNTLQTDSDSDTVGDVCDNCQFVPNPDQEDNDNDSVGTVCDNCPDIYNPGQEDSDGDQIGDACEYICGDATGDETINVSDAVNIINYIFVSGDPPDPIESGDCNCDSDCNVSDAVWIINYVFVGGNQPCDTDGDTLPDC